MHCIQRILSTSKFILIVFFSILAFSSCGLKEYVGDVLSIEYKRSFNKTKSTTSSCIYSKNTSTYTSVAKQKNLYNNRQLYSFLRDRILDYVFLTPSSYPYLYSSNSPPKYILFKRLKIALS